MNILSSYKFQVKSHIKPIIIFFSIIAALYLIDIVGSLVEAATFGDCEVYIGGEEMAVLIFCFAMGISIFSENFHMLTQNGISRKSMYVGRLGTALTVSAACTVINFVLFKIFEFLLKLFELLLVGSCSFSSSSFFKLLYEDYYAGAGYAGGIFTDLLLIFSICTALTSVGYFIATLMYRLPKYGKFLFLGSLWAAPMIVLPILEYIFFDGAILNALYNFILFVTGISCGNPFAMVASCGVIFVVFSAITWFILCKLPVKK